MRLLRCSLALAALATSTAVLAQAPPMGGMAGMQHEEKAAPIANGGIYVPGWMGAVDAGAAKQGQTEKDSLFKKEGNGFHVTTGPAITYWNPSM